MGNINTTGLGGGTAGSAWYPSGTSLIMAYGCPSPPQPMDNPWIWPYQPPPQITIPINKLPSETLPLTTCVRCNRHIKPGDPCIFCMRDDIQRIEARVDKLIQEIATSPPPAQKVPPEKPVKRRKISRRRKKP